MEPSWYLDAFSLYLQLHLAWLSLILPVPSFCAISASPSALTGQPFSDLSVPRGRVAELWLGDLCCLCFPFRFQGTSAQSGAPAPLLETHVHRAAGGSGMPTPGHMSHKPAHAVASSPGRSLKALEVQQLIGDWASFTLRTKALTQAQWATTESSATLPEEYYYGENPAFLHRTAWPAQGSRLW